jgi:simple sugar transport system permease protein
MGMEGQLYIGAWAAVGVGLFVKGPEWLVLLLMLIAAAAAAGLFALIPAWLLLKGGISEILSTILLNYVAVQWVIFFSKDIWRDTSAVIGSAFLSFPVPYSLPVLTNRVHIGILVAVILVIIFSVIMKNSIWGYEVQSIGANKKAARFAGIPVIRHIILIFFISGAISGVAGFIEITGVAHRLSASISNAYGWDGMLASMLAGNSFLAIIPYGLFLALILNGGTVLKTRGLSSNLVQVLIGLILLLSCVGEVLANYHIIKTAPGNLKPMNQKSGIEEISTIDKLAGDFSKKD